jgi:outer membrane receptor protein involved in Fe transport
MTTGQTTVADNMQWGGEFSYTEPIFRKQFLEFNYEYDHEDETSVRNASDIDSFGNHVPNAELSTRFQRDLSIHRTGITWRLNTERSSLSAGLEYQDTGLDGFVNDGESPIRKQMQSWLPNLRWRYELATARSLRVDYSTSIRVPSITQLSPVVDNSDPLNIYLGNPDLQAEYAHRASLHFHSFSQFSFTSIFAMIQGTLTRNKIVNGTSINEAFVETTRPVNIDNDYQLTGYASFGTPLRFIKTRIQLNANVSYNKSLIPVNGINNDLDRLSGTLGLQFQNQNSDVIEYTVGSNWTQSKTKYSESTQQDQDFFTHHYFGDLTLNFLKTWSLSTSMDYRLYTGDQFEENQALPIWKASLSKYVMKGKRGQIKLSVFDLLDENKGLSRTSTANYLEEVRANSIGRYVMLSFLYSIKGFSQSSSGPGVRFIQQRR